jgi:hypothetical protein
VGSATSTSKAPGISRGRAVELRWQRDCMTLALLGLTSLLFAGCG